MHIFGLRQTKKEGHKAGHKQAVVVVVSSTTSLITSTETSTSSFFIAPTTTSSIVIELAPTAVKSDPVTVNLPTQVSSAAAQPTSAAPFIPLPTTQLQTTSTAAQHAPTASLSVFSTQSSSSTIHFIVIPSIAPTSTTTRASASSRRYIIHPFTSYLQHSIDRKSNRKTLPTGIVVLTLLLVLLGVLLLAVLLLWMRRRRRRPIAEPYIEIRAPRIHSPSAPRNFSDIKAPDTLQNPNRVTDAEPSTSSTELEKRNERLTARIAELEGQVQVQSAWVSPLSDEPLPGYTA
ncbi:hypothetical protein C8R44DRAFT_196104 [Mycena epipterygia]|nr:hypothetical protein C8R44DRAFT_196104 [Mycena epipterygia]